MNGTNFQNARMGRLDFGFNAGEYLQPERFTAERRSACARQFGDSDECVSERKNCCALVEKFDKLSSKLERNSCMNDVVSRIREYNQGRNPEILQLKYKAMSESVFGFLRGTCHLFYQDLPVEGIFDSAPAVWSCGDLHLQNFGSFKGDDRLVYFDINDFDESVLAPCTWDVARFLTSVLVAAHTLKISEEDANQLCLTFLATYTAELRTGKDRTVHAESATGMVKDLLEKLKNRKRKNFLDGRTILEGTQRKLKFIEKKTFAATAAERKAVTELIDRFAQTQPNPAFYRVLDVAHRIAGTGSLGLDRYIILVEGNGSPDRNYLLDLKAARSSSLKPFVSLPQPQWQTEADRITSIQFRCQESPPALLNPVTLDGKSFVLRELQPTADRVDLEDGDGKVKRLSKVINIMAQVTAWGELRSRGRQGSASADELIAFAESASDWHKPLLDYVHTYVAQVDQDYQTFRTSFS